MSGITPRRIEWAPGATALWLACAAVELGPALVRGMLALIVGSILGFLLSLPEWLVNAAVVGLALGPIAWSALALLGLEGGGGLIRMRKGARPQSERERRSVEEAFALLAGPVEAPRALFIIDAPTPEYMVVGQTLYLHREVIGDPYLPAVLAHELGHVNSADGRMVLAARRFVLGGDLDRANLVRGGISLKILGRPWDAWMRSREFAADAYAARLGQGAELAAFLERSRFFDVATPLMADRQHPYTEERIERLLEDLENVSAEEAA